MKKFAFNVELANGKFIQKSQEVPADVNTLDYLESKYKQRVLSFEERATGSTTNVNDMNETERIAFEKNKRDCINVAKDFEYGQEVIDRIKAAVTCIQLDNIMASARHAM